MGRHLLLCWLGTLMLAGCVENPGHFTKTTAATPGNALFYLYRPEATTPGLMKPLKFEYPDVLIDGKSIGVLKYNEYLVTELTPGTHTINITGLTQAAKGWAARDIESSFEVGANQQAFMKLRVEYDLNQMNLGQPGAKYLIHLFPVAESDAKYEIRNTEAAQR